MSLVTRCPACSTTFKVVRDQLRISDGWVRCGRCSEVFDATLDLHEAPDGAIGVPLPPQERPAEPPPHTTEPETPVEDGDFFDDDHEQPAAHEAPVQQAESTELPAQAAFVLPAHGIAADEPWSDLDASEPEWRPPQSTLPPFPHIDLNLAAPPPSSPPPPPPLPDLTSFGGLPRLRTRSLVGPTSDEDADAEREQHADVDAHDQVQMQKALRRARAKSAKIAGAKARDERNAAAKASASIVRERSEPELGAEEPPELTSILHGAEAGEEALRFSNDPPPDTGESIWQRAGVRRGLIVAAVLAGLLLALQIVRHERDGIAARQPSLRPALAALCQATGCELSALRQIGDIVIEGAAFAREKSGPNDYRLSFTLRNGATVPLAMPSIELTLLDTQERAVVRRVLTPADFGAPGVLPARADRAASLPLTLNPSEAAAMPPVAGYRVEAFYP